MGLNTGSPGRQTGEWNREKHCFGMPACTRQGIFVSKIMTKHKTPLSWGSSHQAGLGG